MYKTTIKSQCTYRCGVLPDASLSAAVLSIFLTVSMHLQVRGAP